MNELTEIKNDRGIMVLDCGLYRSYECQIKRKYSRDRSPVVLPDEFMCLIVPDNRRDEVLEILSKHLRPASPQDTR